MEMKTFVVIVTLALTSACLGNDAWASYEVKGKCASPSIFYVEGKIEQEPCSDEVVYEVIPEEKKIIRKAVVSGGAGLQADNSEYTILYDMPDKLMPTRDKKGTTQRLIKGFGQVAADGGYEMLVIGDDFITTAKSGMNYFTLYHYKRIE